MPTFNLPNKVRLVKKASSIDEFYGPYNSVEEAIEIIGDALLGSDEVVGRHIGVYDSNGKVVDYIYQKDGDGYAFERIAGEGGGLDEDSEYTISKSFNTHEKRIGALEKEKVNFLTTEKLLSFINGVVGSAWEWFKGCFIFGDSDYKQGCVVIEDVELKHGGLLV